VKYDADIIALTYAGGALPATADARIELAVDRILPAAADFGLPTERIYFDPLVLTVNGNQDQAQQTIEGVRFFKQMSDPAPLTVCGLSNISNGAPEEVRRVLNRVFLVMMLGAGLDAAIVDPLDTAQMDAVRIVETRDDSTALGRLYIALYDGVAAGEVDLSSADLSDPAQVEVVRTVEILQNKWVYAHSYLKA
jgi:5-methyltetrahydrofolate corrinoid/iron sulfur protein methyltransferase